MCIGASLSSNDQQPIKFPGERALEEGEAVGSRSQKNKKTSKWQLPPTSATPLSHPYCLALFFPILCKCCQEWTKYGLPCARICALRRVLSLSCSAWRSVMPGESCPLAFISMPVGRSSRKYAIWILPSLLTATQFRTQLFTSQSEANWTMLNSQTLTPCCAPVHICLSNQPIWWHSLSVAPKTPKCIHIANWPVCTT